MATTKSTASLIRKAAAKAALFAHLFCIVLFSTVIQIRKAAAKAALFAHLAAVCSADR